MLATGLSHNPMSRTLLNSADSLPRCTTPGSILEQSVPQRRSNPKTAGLELEPQFQHVTRAHFPGSNHISTGFQWISRGKQACHRVSRFWSPGAPGLCQDSGGSYRVLPSLGQRCRSGWGPSSKEVKITRSYSIVRQLEILLSGRY